MSVTDTEVSTQDPHSEVESLDSVGQNGEINEQALFETEHDKSEHDKTVIEHPPTSRRVSSRERKQTEKGAAFEIELYTKRYKSAVLYWRKSLNETTVLMSDATDASRLREARDKVIRDLTEVNDVYGHLSSLPIVEPQRSSYNEQFEEVQKKHNDFLCQVSDRIYDLNVEVQSRVSGRSSRSSRTRYSTASNFSRHSYAAAEAAALTAKLRYIDAEAKSRAELEKIVTKRKLEMAQAKLGILDEAAAGSIGVGLQLPAHDKCKMEGTKEYVESHAKFFTDVGPKEDINQLEAKSPGVVVHSNLVDPSSDPLAPLHDLQSHDLVKSEPHVTSSLDPNVKSFEPSKPVGMVQDPSIGLDKSVNAAELAQVPPVVAPYSVVTETGNSASEEILKLTKTLAEQIIISRLPPPEPTVFEGDPLKFPGWMSAFHTLIEQKQIPASEKIHYLKKYLSGSVREVVENYFLLSSEDAFEEAKKLLEQRYGDPFVISNAFRNKLEKWPKIMNRDGEGLRKFADFLKQCHTAMESMKCLSILDDERENRKLLLKLPEWIVNRWNRQVAVARENEKRFPSFKEFMEFITKEARIACDPVTSLQALKSDHTHDSAEKADKSWRVDKRYPGRRRAFLTEVKDSSVTFSSNATRSQTDSLQCYFCKKRNHELGDCRIFLRKSLEERKVFIREKKLCYGCLSVDHMSKQCKTRKRCETCNKLHPTCLHGDTKPIKGRQNDESMESKKEESKEGIQGVNNHKISLERTSLMSQNRSCCMSAMILPVYVSHEGDPSIEKLVYALLDSQSDTTFILEKTCDSLGISGADVKLSLSTMYAENKVVESQRIKGLSVRGFNHSLRIPLPVAYTRQIMPANRSHIPTPEVAEKIPYLQAIASELVPQQDCEIGLLIGYNCARALLPREVIASERNGPFAQRTDLGWGIVGLVDGSCDEELETDSVGISHRVLVYEVDPSLHTADDKDMPHDKVFISLNNKVKEVISPAEINKLMTLDFVELKSNHSAISIEDKRFLDIVQNSIKKVDGHYEMPLPLKNSDMNLPNNRVQAQQRLESLRRRLSKDKKYQQHYQIFMQDMIKGGYAEKVPKSDLQREDGKVWYIPHHGVYHPKKPEKIRVVFDCSATYRSESLNSNLLQGPDLTNTLIGVLGRFRKENIAFMCDVEQMFFQFKVCPDQRDLLRFLWWENNDISMEPTEYRMCVHLFGAVSSPGCANFGLKQIATDNEDEFGSDVAKFLRRDFYVDDGLTCVPDEEQAISLITRTVQLCAKGGVRLHKFLSNSKMVIQSIPVEYRAKGLVDVDLLEDPLPIERALGVQWCVESDSFQFRITLSDKPLTRRGILSTVSSVYDPLGMISPVVLVGKQILQELCANQLSWDDPLPESLKSKWERWRTSVSRLENLKIRRCYKPDNFGTIVKSELHHFSDASNGGYGQCSYLRLVNEHGQVYCSLVMSKARVIPLKPITIPRLELSAAVISVKISSLLQQELDFQDVTEWYWTDSKIVLAYIANDARRFHVFVANRLQQIHDHTVPSQWRHIDSKDNPADIASRGVSADDLMNDPKWFDGPRLLWEPELPETDKEQEATVDTEDKELKKVKVLNTCADGEYHSRGVFIEGLQRFSSLDKMKRVIALCLRFVRNLKRCLAEQKNEDKPVSDRRPDNEASSTMPSLTVEEMTEAEHKVIKAVQREAFEKELTELQRLKSDASKSERSATKERKSTLKGHSSIYRLDPFIDSVGLLRVGGRLSRAQVSPNVKHPIILPKTGYLTELIVQHFHVKVSHQGRGITSNEIRGNGFWIVGLSSVVSNHISRCVTCRRLRGFAQGQKMADLPTDRLEPAPPFSYCGVDYFGPFYIREGRKELKRYGVIFTCLCCRAIHLETAASLTTDSFISALRRFIAIRGPIRLLRSDRGTNFIGAENELKAALSELDEHRIKQFLLTENCDCDVFEFRFNVPNASHMGGIWERQIRSVRNVLSSLLFHHGTQLDDESMRTLMCEAAAIVNSRPLSVQDINDPLSAEPLTPNHLLTMKSKLILPPPGQFQKTDLYCRKRWRRVQYLANEFWSRWKKEYLQINQVRSKWQGQKRNTQVGDVVLICDENQSRNLWHLGKVVEANPDKDGLVRTAKVLVGTAALDSKGKRVESVSYLERPIHKLVLIHESKPLVE